jgi:hypothetical protein
MRSGEYENGGGEAAEQREGEKHCTPADLVARPVAAVTMPKTVARR